MIDETWGMMSAFTSLLGLVLITAAVFLFPGQQANAGTFCIAGPALQPQCLYEDVDSCERDAAAPDTYCTVNPEAYLMYHGSQRYCTVQPDHLAQCLYDDRSQCNREAGRNKAICIDRETIKDDTNPFRFDNRIQY
jgi:hypothetical protein